MSTLPELVSQKYQSAYGTPTPFLVDEENKHLLFNDSVAKIVTQNDIQVSLPPNLPLWLMAVLNPVYHCSTT
jgi:hypothetical protein